MEFDVHYAAFACSPNYKHHNVFTDRKVRNGLEEILKHFLDNDRARVATALAQWAEFKNDATFNQFDAAKTMSSKTWWQLYGTQWPVLQEAAVKIFSVGTSSLSAERNFSTFAHVWNKKSNSLSFDTANKLVFCWQNIRALLQLQQGTAPKKTVDMDWLANEILS